MKVSVIIPVYNVENFIIECLDSIKQLQFEYEIIVVNDGSKDNSLIKVKEFANSFKGELTIVDKQNGGLSSARNVGIKYSTGDYILFLDSDDFVDGQMLKLFVLDVFRDGVDIGFANFKYLINGQINDNKITNYRRKIASKVNNITDGITFGERFFDKRHNFFNVEACFLLVKKSLLTDNSIEFKQGIYHEDTLFTLSCLMVSDKVRYYDYPFYIYRMRSDSIMHTTCNEVIQKKIRDKGTIAFELFDLLQKNHISAFFIESLIADLLIVYAMYFKIKSPEISQVLSCCNKLTFKSKIRVAIYKLKSFCYG